MVDNPDYIGEPTEKVDWDYWRRMYAGMAMQGLCRERVSEKTTTQIAYESVMQADALIEELKKTK